MGEGTPSGYSVGSTTEVKELCTGGRPNDEGDVLYEWITGVRAYNIAPDGAGDECADRSTPQKQRRYKRIIRKYPIPQSNKIHYQIF